MADGGHRGSGGPQRRGRLLRPRERPEARALAALIARRGGASQGPGRAPSEFSLAHNVRSPQEVDDVLALAHRAGARVANPPAKRDWGGYSGYFQDPDGHVWEIAWNPAWEVA